MEAEWTKLRNMNKNRKYSLCRWNPISSCFALKRKSINSNNVQTTNLFCVRFTFCACSTCTFSYEMKWLYFFFLRSPFWLVCALGKLKIGFSAHNTYVLTSSSSHSPSRSITFSHSAHRIFSQCSKWTMIYDFSMFTEFLCIVNRAQHDGIVWTWDVCCTQRGTYYYLLACSQ